MFIYCFDEQLKNKLIEAGYKMAEKSNGKDYWIFLNKSNLTFDFSNIDKNKFKMSNKLNF